MRTVDPRSGIESLDRPTCLSLLAGEEIGRLAVVAGGAPVVVPVNFALDGEAVVVRTEPGAKLDQGVRSPACFEVDSFDRATRTGWSVIVAGRLEEVTPFDGPDFERLRALGVDPWVGPGRDHFLRLVPTRLTGRRIGPRS
ncbi:MAG TPA: pyridoxamine 5'-phosphate oxidase family protein [Acidimicrobiales bacterium]|nr:pyridoxamine 5'-phosphate oxidase family protein [Acidimicrobiales bacterium]